MHKKITANSTILIYLVLTLLTFVVFANVRNYDFITLDDVSYVTDNDNVKSGLTTEGLRWAFTTNRQCNWHPLTWLSHMLDCQLFDLNAGRHHLTNLFFHIINTLLLFTVLKQMTKATWRSAFVAAAFAVHPLHVESVAWVSERKDVLSTLFWILTIGAYTHYSKRRSTGWYILTMIVFALGLMAKPMLVTLPFVLLLLDYWPLCRLELGNRLKPTNWSDFYRLVLEKIPFFALSVISSVITFLLQRSAMIGVGRFPVIVRTGRAFTSYLKYIEKTFWPTRLAVFYPAFNVFFILPTLVAAILIFVACWYIIKFARSRKYLPVGWFWYLGTLVPVIGLVQVGGQSWANRYTYIPIIGLFIIVAWGLPDLLTKLPYRKIIISTIAVAVISTLSVCTYFQVQYWRDSKTLYTQAIEAVDNNYVAHLLLARVLSDEDKPNEAIEHYKQVIRIKPDYVEVYNEIGLALVVQGKFSEAIEYYNEALRLNPNYFEAHLNIAVALSYQGQYDKAKQHYKQALRIRSDFVAPTRFMNILTGRETLKK